ncbi:siroheme synthase CysG [Devosia algicola]|uniref:Siroheme synthase CysG n=1 Tax=Devosia algicola TaxID=3026418 RepID=A0ABY7YR96_9HYPH|nr:siroheme synthase CysG [Devosia algicola]WDR03781.1 siroheme synthase CysG [Devosia algicola]
MGGGVEALNKARLVTKTSAQTVVIAPNIDADFSGLDVTLHRRPFRESDLDDAALIFVTDNGPDGMLAKCAARARRVALNVVDVPAECDFYTPSIIDRAPLTIAIATEGTAPVLARLVRARIEAMLSPRLGAIAALAGRMRRQVEALIGDSGSRRRYYEDLVQSAEVDIAVATDQGNIAAEALLGRHLEHKRQGSVALIGAGPGSEDLLTLRAQRLLQQADVIVHDQLVPDLVVQMGRRDAEVIAVGKAKGHHSFSQAQINSLLVRLAGQGKQVARLKSGDPMVFGRAGEEIAALRRADISYSIVPGISAAMAAAADSATPLTLRKVSSGLVMATAHGADDIELDHWAALAAAGITLALYMGKSIADKVATKLIAHGVSSQLPVGIVINAGRSDRAFYRGTLGALAGGTVPFPAGPAIILAGEAVAAGDWSGAADVAVELSKVA